MKETFSRNAHGVRGRNDGGDLMPLESTRLPPAVGVVAKQYRYGLR